MTTGSEQVKIRRVTDEREPVFSGICSFLGMLVDAQFGGGGCRDKNRPEVESAKQGA